MSNNSNLTPPQNDTSQLPPSDAERFKRESDFLRGTIAQDLTNEITGGFNSDNSQLIRPHGMYQQDDRDIRAERIEQKLEPLINMMLRCRLPGGIITPQQWLAIDKFAQEDTFYGSIRLTTRQTFQFHGIFKRDLKSAHQLLHKIGLDSIATAGDVNRNVLCTTNPIESAVHQQAYQWASKISEHLLPKTRAYVEIWLDGEKLETQDEEPILSSQYLPRKFKTAIVIPPTNDVDVHANDLSFVAIAKHGQLIGFNVLVGGGLAMTHGDKSTYPRKADDFGFIPVDATLKCAEAVVTTQRDWGNRSNRKNAKTKYTLERVGVENFKKEVELRAGLTFLPSVPYQFTQRGDQIGWYQGFDRRWHLTLFIENGRLLDYPNKPLKTGVAEIAKIHQGDFRLTANQNLIVANVESSHKQVIEQLARQYGLIDDSVTLQRKNAMACVSFPTCPLAMAEAERFLPDFITTIDHILHKNQLAQEYIILRVTGCPNGCGRAMLAEIGLVGKALGRYNLYLGGDRAGTRIPRLYKENITVDEILAIIEPLIENWSQLRLADEGFGDFVIRTKVVKPIINSAIDFYD
ncbi:sulfite reductase (NADPH) beta subunit [Orbus hercynius]|uniref:Sulfite reductase [NADPH] hemoprotein beta-component n=1 Tax=Orbus hercynius TaxID=593135 RepID=A0A495RLY6_9GAMM|nr:assimilatory sulfite reductase (NADPH) hemoprotein subunit [Orbus hercynius]RKS87818.1 sulfite reductase (NADPH) beta subunit [Orbus hercynius]